MKQVHIPPIPERLLTVAQVAERCQVSPRSVRRWIDDGQLPVLRLGRSVRVSDGDLATFLSHCKSRR
jgi:excisionase family DNA binding protein